MGPNHCRRTAGTGPGPGDSAQPVPSARAAGEHEPPKPTDACEARRPDRGLAGRRKGGGRPARRVELRRDSRRGDGRGDGRGGGARGGGMGGDQGGRGVGWTRLVEGGGWGLERASMPHHRTEIGGGGGGGFPYVFFTCCHARITCDSRMAVGFLTRATCKKCDTNHIPRATA